MLQTLADGIARSLSIMAIRNKISLMMDNLNTTLIVRMERPGNYRLVSLASGHQKVREHILLVSASNLLKDKKQSGTVYKYFPRVNHG